MLGVAGENGSPDFQPGCDVQENARFSGLTVTLGTQVQVMEDTAGGGSHLGPSLVDFS